MWIRLILPSFFIVKLLWFMSWQLATWLFCNRLQLATVFCFRLTAVSNQQVHILFFFDDFLFLMWKILTLTFLHQDVESLIFLITYDILFVLSMTFRNQDQDAWLFTASIICLFFLTFTIRKCNNLCTHSQLKWPLLLSLCLWSEMQFYISIMELESVLKDLLKC